MRIGKLNRQVSIQANQSVLDEYGEPLPAAWVEVAKVWADVQILSGLQTIKEGVDVSVVKASMRIRYREDLTAAMRVVYQGRVFDIRAVLPDVSKREYLDLVCESGQNQG